jgi:hypothetical protein
MVICKSTAQAYYPALGKAPNSICGSRGRVRYVRGFLLIRPKPHFDWGDRGGRRGETG